ncbi:uncharacterized protein LOC119088771 [Peromyscus leucopus]|uniref:uncharacterized protein LOC119088771 n=1 Tax=Peromyscus leucopus TaxID=10041 RepID=UPI0018853B9C|nr:uncharacterized protein LOC119088771 [Peromyscus leucopus]
MGRAHLIWASTKSDWMGRNEGSSAGHLGLPWERGGLAQLRQLGRDNVGVGFGKESLDAVGKLSNCLLVLEKKSPREGYPEANGAARMARLARRGPGRDAVRRQLQGAARVAAAWLRVPEAQAAGRSAHSRALLAEAARGRSGLSARPPCGAPGRAPGFQTASFGGRPAHPVETVVCRVPGQWRWPAHRSAGTSIRPWNLGGRVPIKSC